MRHALPRASAVALALSLLATVPGRAQTNPASRVSVGGPPVTGVIGVGEPDTTTSTTILVVDDSTTTVAAPTTSTTLSNSTAVLASTTSPRSSTTTTAKRIAAGSTTTSPPPATPAQLQAALLNALGSSNAGLRSIVIVIDGQGTVFESNPDLALPPASAIKLTAAGAALLRLGAEHRFVTRVISNGTADVGGRFIGDLVVSASGDPSLSLDDLDELAAAVASSGVRLVNGDLVVDDSRFENKRRNEGWKNAFVPGEVGALSSFMVAGNRRGDTASLNDPDLANLSLFRDALRSRGVVIDGVLRRGPAPEGVRTLATHGSAPLAKLLAKMVKDSDNTYAEQILRELGREVGIGSTANGVSVIARLFRDAALTPPVQFDASGLSSLNRASSRQLVNWLRVLDTSSVKSAFRSTLAVSCTDGTLKARFCDAKGRVLAKTGTLDSVRTLAGFATTQSGRSVTYAFLFAAAPSSRDAIDKMMAILTSYAG